MSTETTISEVTALEPGLVWSLFAGIAAIPRPSNREEMIRVHVRTIAERNGFAVCEDSVGNLIVEVPATKGSEHAAITVLQAHLDMVCEKNAGTEHDFNTDPIQLNLTVDPSGAGPVVSAAGTTLGADNGIGVALGLAAAMSPEVVHGPLELLFTIDEEAGMTGAKALGPTSIRGKRLLNLDSEEDDTIYIGCAGGCDTELSFRLPTQPPGAANKFYRMNVAGLRGGHSGGDIQENRGNAIKLLVRALLDASPDGLGLVSIDGGNLRNAIPREAAAVVAGPASMRAALQQAAEKVRLEAAAESAERNVSISVEEVSGGDIQAVVGAADTRRVLDTITGLPYGVLGMHPTLAGLVETSNNVATVASSTSSAENSMTVTIGTLSRSSSSSRIREVLAHIAAVGRLAGADVKADNEYPGWAPELDSPTLDCCKRVYEKLFGAEPHVAAIHAGLECGVIGKQVGGMDMVSFGPRIEGAHSPEECVWVESVQKCWTYLKAVLAELAKS